MHCYFTQNSTKPRFDEKRQYFDSIDSKVQRYESYSNLKKEA